MIGDFLNFLASGVFGFINGFLGIFPQMGLTATDIQQLTGVQTVAQILAWVNWFLPLDIASSMIALWATGMISYVGIKLAMRYTGEIV